MFKNPPPRVTGTVDPTQAFADLQRRTTRVPTIRLTTPEGQSDIPAIDFEPQQRRQTLRSVDAPQPRQTLSRIDTRSMSKVGGPRPFVAMAADGSLTPPETPKQTVTETFLRIPTAQYGSQRRSEVTVRSTSVSTPKQKPTIPSVAAARIESVSADKAPVIPSRPASITSSGPASTTFFVIPGGSVVPEYALPAEYVGYQVACDDFPNMKQADWIAFGQAMQAAPFVIAPEAWGACVTLIASLPTDQQKTAIEEIRSVICERQACEDIKDNAPRGLFLALRELPISFYRDFGHSITAGASVTSQRPGELARTMRTLAEGFTSLERLLNAAGLTEKQKFYLRKTACLAAENLGHLREQSLTQQQRKSCALPLDERGVARILSVVVRESARPNPVVNLVRWVSDLVDLLVSKSILSGPVSAELLAIENRYDGIFVANALFEEFQHRVGSGTKPSATLAKALYAEGRERAKKQLMDQKNRDGVEPAAFRRFKAQFGAVFDAHDWERPFATPE